MLNPYKLTLLEVADLLEWTPTLPQLREWRLSTMTDRWSPVGIATRKMDEKRGVHLDRWAEIDAFREAMKANGGVMVEIFVPNKL